MLDPMSDTTSAATPRHPISVVAERSGLSPDLLRVWERRYGVVEPARDDGGRRLYSDADIERLRLLAQASAGGRTVGQLVALSVPALQALVREDEAARWSAQAPVATADEAAFVTRALERTRALDSEGLAQELGRAATVLGAFRFLEGVVAPLFRAIGDGWHAGEMSIAQEHMATATARWLLAQLRSALPAVEWAPLIVVGTPAGDTHEIGALLVAGVAAAEGWRVAYLGTNAPASELADTARRLDARAVAVSSVYAADAAELVSELQSLRAGLPGDVALIVGGAAAGGLAGEHALDGIAFDDSLADLRTRLRGSRR
jgi:MerR family transcriptional regulator, light-induced transcriptional regulator